jgi:ATP-binding cassette, subfamily B, bacterial
VTRLSDYLSTRLRRLTLEVRHVPRTLCLVWQAAPGWTLASAVLLLIQGALPVATVYLTRPIVDGIAAAMRSDGDWRPILLPAAWMGFVLLLTEVSRGLTQWVRTAQADLVQDHIADLIHRKSIEVDLAFYESPEFYDHLHRARAEAGHRPIALLESLGSLLQNGITLIAMLGVLAGFAWGLPVALFVSSLPAMAVVLRYAERQHEFRNRTTPIERRAWYYDWLLTTGEAAPEIRLFGLGNHFRAAYTALRERLRGEKLALARGQGFAEMFAGVSALAVTAGALLWMVARTFRGVSSLGDLALFYQAFQQGLRLARGLLENLGQTYQNSLFLGNLFEFLALTPRVVSPAQPVAVPNLSDGIRFSDVTFRYPDTRKVALQSFNLTVPAGRIVAIVGPNGAGKSTLVKLLCRFYDPESGSITIDGVDLRSLSVDELRASIAVLFQQPVQYNATVKDNIQLGAVSQSSKDEDIQSAATAAGADTFIDRLPGRYDNLLGHWFEKGTELSVGEWQRIALARACFRQSPILLLDEPTSAMDPWAEADWLRRFRTFATGRTAILITHRFTTAMLADEIHVIEDGHVVESGSHQDLIHRQGRYAAWWAAQHTQS